MSPEFHLALRKVPDVQSASQSIGLLVDRREERGRGIGGGSGKGGDGAGGFPTDSTLPNCTDGGSGSQEGNGPEGVPGGSGGTGSIQGSMIGGGECYFPRVPPCAAVLHRMRHQ